MFTFIISLKRHARWVLRTLFFVCFFVASACNAATTVDLSSSADDWGAQVRAAVPQEFLLNKLSYVCDVSVEPREFEYLVGMREGATVTAADVERAVGRLFAKKLFETIRLTLTDVGAGKHLQYELGGAWRLNKLKFHGMLIGKEKYRQYYMMEPGETFDEKKHQRSLERIQQSFKSNGYFEGTVEDELERDAVTKSVTAHLSLSRGPRFKIGQIVVARAHDKRDTDESSELEHVRYVLHKKLAHKGYSKDLITAEIESLKRSLSGKGFLHVGINLSEKIKRATRTVDLSFTFDFLEKRQFVFFGNAFFTQDELLDKLFELGDAVHMIPATILVEDLEKEYHKKGFWAVRIEVKEEPHRDFFIIHEGARCTIAQVECVGAQVFDTKMLEHKFFRALLHKDSFDQDLVDDGTAQLIAWYHEHGYLNINVLKYERIKLDGTDEQYKLQITIEEGEQSVLKAITIPDFQELLTHPWFVRCLENNVSLPFDPNRLEEQREWLKRQLRIQGYPHAYVKADLERDGHFVTVVWRITKGDPAPFFGKTVVQGCCGLPFDVIEKSLAHHEGEPWNDAKLKTSVDRLRKLGIFESVNLYPSKTPCLDNSKDLLLKLCKDDPFEVRFRSGLGLQGVDRHFAFGRGVTYKLGGTFLFKNPTNAGDCFMLDGDIARSRNHLDIEYDRPHLFGIPSSTRIKGYLSTYEQPGFVGSKKDLYDILQQGFLIGAREKWHNCEFGLNLGCEWMRTSMKQDSVALAAKVAQAINFKSDLLGRKLPYFFMEPIVVVDRLDEKMNPTFGTFSLVTAKGMLSLCDRWQDASFVKVMGEHSMFYPLTPIITGGFHVRLGHIFFQKFQDIMPFERFYLGGANSIRSYEADLCPPICSFKDDEGNCYTVPQGGKTMAHINAELRFPIWKNINGVVFQDLGTLIGQSVYEFDSSRLLAATGFGLRYNTPIGPLRFDVGWKWRLSHPNDYSYSWFLTIGHAF